MEKICFASLLLLASLALCQGRVVRVPSGPLVRVEGQAVSIRCNVSEYEGPRDQDFEWMMLQGQNQFQLISTFDSSYPNALFKNRVSSGDISIKKITDSSVELKIKKVRATDSATYQCSTPSTDTVFSGNYKADVELKVIGDSLKVAPSIPQPMVSEGEQLELHCNTTRAFTEHTSLSVTWSFKVGGSPMAEILTFGPDDKVTVGDSSAQRYAEGGLRLDLRGGGFYGLVLSGARPEDQGKYVCTVRLWVRQGGGSLHKILEKSEDMGNVTVKPTDTGNTDPDQEWLSYVYFCRGIVTLVFMVMLISFLSLHGCKQSQSKMKSSQLHILDKTPQDRVTVVMNSTAEDIQSRVLTAE